MDEQTKQTVLMAAYTIRAVIDERRAAGDREALWWLSNVGSKVNNAANNDYRYWDTILTGPEKPQEEAA